MHMLGSFPFQCLGVAQLVARYLGVVEAVGSSPVTQTMKTTQLRVNRDCVVFVLCGKNVADEKMTKNAPCPRHCSLPRKTQKNDMQTQKKRPESPITGNPGRFTI